MQLFLGQYRKLHFWPQVQTKWYPWLWLTRIAYNCGDNVLLCFDLVILITLSMLNCLKDYKRCIHILYHISEFVQQKKTNFTMGQPYMLLIPYCQYHACWCLVDSRSQGISRHDIDQISQNIPSLASEELRVCKVSMWFILSHTGLWFLLLLLNKLLNKQPRFR